MWGPTHVTARDLAIHRVLRTDLLREGITVCRPRDFCTFPLLVLCSKIADNVI
jgi:hypothetical protein